jgi:hypothetical protein
MKRKKETIKAIVMRVWPEPTKDEIEQAGARILSRLMEELKKPEYAFRSLYGDGWTVQPVNQREFQVLSAVEMLGGNGDTVEISDVAEEWAPGLNIAAVSNILGRLEQRGLLISRTSRLEGAGSLAQRYRLAHDGKGALLQARREEMELADAREGFSEGESPERLR